MSRITHVLLDFFGTLVNFADLGADEMHARSYALLRSTGYDQAYDHYVQEWDASFEDFNRQSQVDLREYALDEVCRAFLTRAYARPPSTELVEQFRDAYVQDWNHWMRYPPGIEALVRDLSSRYALALVTNTCHAPLVRGHLQSLGVECCFSAIVTSIEEGKRKPSPSIFARALELTLGSAETSVHVGDSYEADYLGAKAAGIDCLLIDPHRRYPIPAEHRIDSVLDLRARLLD